MHNPVISALKEQLDYIKIKSEPTFGAFTNDKPNTAESREVTVQEFIASYLEPDCRIVKGSIYAKATFSNNIDCVVLLPNHPKIKTHARELIVAEGVYAAVEVKPDLTNDKELIRGLEQIQSVKKIDRYGRHALQGLGKRHNRQSSCFFRIPGVIFSFKSKSLEQIVHIIQQQHRSKQISAFELPDIIISIDKGILFYCPKIKETWFAESLDRQYKTYPDEMFVEFPLLGTEQLVWFLKLFLDLPNHSLLFEDHILFSYLEDYDSQQVSYHALNASDVFEER